MFRLFGFSLVLAAQFLQASPALPGPKASAPGGSVGANLTGFTLPEGGPALAVLRWKGHLAVYRLHRGIPVLVDPAQLPLVGSGRVNIQAGSIRKRVPADVLKAYLVQHALPVPEGCQLFIGILGSQPGHPNRLQLLLADTEVEVGSGARYAVTGLTPPFRLGNILAVGYLEEGAASVEQRNQPLLHIHEWIGF